MRHFLLSLLVPFMPIIGFSQKKTNTEKAEIAVQASMQKNIDHLTNNNSSKIDYISLAYKTAGLQPFVDSNIFLQPFKLDLGKEIKPATSLKINGILLETTIDYWPFSFCPSTFFAGTATWGSMEMNQPFLYDLKTDIEKNKQISTAELTRLIKTKANTLATSKISALIVYNSTDITDSLLFNTNDTANLSPIPVLYFTKSGIRKLKDESTIANAIDAKIELGENIVAGTNVIGYINNNAANTVIIATSNKNNYAITISFEVAKQLIETCKPINKKNSLLNIKDYNNNNYLFVNFSDLGDTYFLKYLPLGIDKINYAITINTTGSPTDTSAFLILNNSSYTWNNILKNPLPSFVLKNNNQAFNSSNFIFDDYKIPSLYLLNPTIENLQKNKSVTVNKNDTKTIDFIMQLISDANKAGKIAF